MGNNKKYEPYILKYKAHILKYVPCIFCRFKCQKNNKLKNRRKMRFLRRLNTAERGWNLFVF